MKLITIEEKIVLENYAKKIKESPNEIIIHEKE